MGLPSKACAVGATSLGVSDGDPWKGHRLRFAAPGIEASIGVATSYQRLEHDPVFQTFTTALPCSHLSNSNMNDIYY